jgi:hypothetical protein
MSYTDDQTKGRRDTSCLDGLIFFHSAYFFFALHLSKQDPLRKAGLCVLQMNHFMVTRQSHPIQELLPVTRPFSSLDIPPADPPYSYLLEGCRRSMLDDGYDSDHS